MEKMDEMERMGAMAAEDPRAIRGLQALLVNVVIRTVILVLVPQGLVVLLDSKA
jgi:hypothetical protein